MESWRPTQAMSDTKNIVVLISGSGSNLQAILDACARGAIPGRVAAVISNRPGVFGLDRAQRAGVPAEVVDHTHFPDRESFEQALASRIDAHAPDLVVLAGFMRLLTPAFVARYAGRMLNIHPSLLPELRGLHTHRRAIERGVARHGASVHFVTAELDGGPVVIQAAVPVEPGDTPETLAARVLEREHVIYPEAVRLFCEGRLAMKDGQAWLDGNLLESPLRA